MTTSTFLNPNPTTNGQLTTTAMDAQFLREPGCIVCSTKVNEGNINARGHDDRVCVSQVGKAQGVAEDTLYINRRLSNDWLRVSEGNVQPPADLTPIGRYSDLNLYTSDEEKYHQFVLFILQAVSQGGGGGGGSAKKATGMTILQSVSPTQLINPE
jgi:hypothetical protein